MDRRVINPWTWQDQFGFVQANEISGAQRTLMCAGQTSVDEDGNPINSGDMTGQLSQCLDNLETVLTEAGFGLGDVVRLNYYTTDVSAFIESAEDSLGSRMAAAGCRPASTLLGVASLFHPDIMIELEATAVV